MIDLKLIRENPELVKENMKKKFREDLEIVDKLKELDERWKKIKYDEEQLRAQRNKLSEEINELKKAKKDSSNLIKKAKEVPEKISELNENRKNLEKEIFETQIKIPNIMSERVPIGKDDSENVPSKYIGKPREFDFEVKNHAEITEELGVADFDSASRVAGTGFYYIEGDLALLNQALIRFGVDFMISKGYHYVETPLMLKEEVIDKVTDITDKQQQIYTTNDNLALIGTSEHSLIGRFVGQEINNKNLPIKNTSYSMCFRKEIGSHGIDEKGLFRTHQFNKIEMIVICKPEDSEKYYEEFKSLTTEIFEKLGIPVRVLEICSGDLGDLKYEQVDIEAYSPRKKDYIEVGSCSNLTGAQARKLGITTRIKGERMTPHTLNNTAIATSRALVAIIENNQQKDGSIIVPEILRPYMNGKEKIVSRK